MPKLQWHLLCTFHLFLMKGSLTESILWRVGNDESLMKFWCCARHVFVIKSFIISRKDGIDIKFKFILPFSLIKCNCQTPVEIKQIHCFCIKILDRNTNIWYTIQAVDKKTNACCFAICGCGGIGRRARFRF